MLTLAIAKENVCFLFNISGLKQKKVQNGAPEINCKRKKV